MTIFEVCLVTYAHVDSSCCLVQVGRCSKREGGGKSLFSIARGKPIWELQRDALLLNVHQGMAVRDLDKRTHLVGVAREESLNGMGQGKP